MRVSSYNVQTGNFDFDKEEFSLIFQNNCSRTDFMQTNTKNELIEAMSVLP